MKIIRGKLTADDITPPSLRYDTDCACVQFSPDGGVTWVDDPSDDPRSAPKFAKPALTGSDIQCRAAANMTLYMENTLDGLFTATSVIQIGAGLLGVGILILTGGAGIIVDVFLAAAEAISALTLTAVEAAFTPTIYSEIQCILYCELDGTGFITSDGLATAQEKVDLLGNSIVSDVFAVFISMWGVNGFNNAGVLLTASHDCSDCDCGWCYEFDFTVSDGGWSIAISGALTEGEYVSGLGFRMSALQDDGCSGHGYLNISYSLGLTTDNITGLELWWANPNPDAGTQFFDQVLSGTLELRQGLSAEISNTNPSFSVTATSCDTVRFVNFQCGQNESFPFYISKARFSGTGTNPFGTSNC